LAVLMVALVGGSLGRALGASRVQGLLRVISAGGTSVRRHGPIRSDLRRSALCASYASPSGSDSSGNGQLAAPYRTVAKLDAALAPGRTGCLEAGTYGSFSTSHYLTNSGSADANITIAPAPGQIATVVGLVDLAGSYTTIAGLRIDGSNNRYTSERPGTNCPFPVSDGLEIDGRDDIFQDNDLYQSVPSLRGNGIGIGWNGQADGTIVRYNRIHDLGQCQAYDQMIYLSHGDGVQIYDNWMWNDPHGWGVQIYPAASHAHVYDNVIDGAGSGFVVGGSASASDNTIDHNIVMDSTGLPWAGLPRGVGISDSWASIPGAGNVFRDNDIYHAFGGIARVSHIALADNTKANPDLVSPETHDYRAAASSRITYPHLWNGVLRALTG
jgi:hypothetical protein